MLELRAIPTLLFNNRRQITAYGVVGIGLMVLYLSTSIGLHYLADVSAQIASPVAFVLCVPVAYLAQSVLVFQSRWLNAKQILRFVVTMATGFVISATAVPLLSWTLGLPEIVSLLSVSALVPLANFIVFRFWVFD